MHMQSNTKHVITGKDGKVPKWMMNREEIGYNNKIGVLCILHWLWDNVIS